MREKAFILTADALFALTAIGLLATAYAVLGSSRPQAVKYADLEQQGRDYLELVYRGGFDNFTADNFSTLTLHNCSGGCLGTRFWGFDSEAEAGEWNNLSTDWSYDAATHVYKFTNSNPVYSSSYTGKPSWSSYNITARVLWSNWAKPGVGLYANATGARYACIIHSGSVPNPNSIHLEKIARWGLEPGIQSSITLNISVVESTVGDYENGWHTINFSVRDGNLTCIVDNGLNNQTAIFYDPAPLHAGMATLETRGGSAAAVQFDNVSVGLVPERAPAGANFSLRASMLEYPWACGCNPAAAVCYVNKTERCLGGQERLDRSWIVREAWVS
ncbi:MAG: hypothetical protein V1708_05770 [Candidatus Micrarchaeota archaeon]